MKRLSLHLFALALVLSGASCCESTLAQEAGNNAKPPATSDEKEWYYGPTSQAETKTLGRQKAEIRARARLSRLNSMRWYGFTPGRPTASGIPFTTMYSPAWTRPGGRPFAWYTSQRPVVLVSPYYPSYYR